MPLSRRRDGALLVAFVLLLAALVSGCKRKPPAPVTVEGELRGPAFVFDAAVIHFAAPPATARDEAKKAFEAASFVVANVPFSDPPKVPTVVILTPTLAAYPPPSLESLKYAGKGLDDATKQAIQHPAAVTAISVAGPADKAIASYRTAMKVLLALEKAAPGVIVDDETRQTFSREKFEERSAAFSGDVPIVREHVVVHVYKRDTMLRAVSLGMRKFALPDLAVDEVPQSNASAMVALMTFTMQTYAERPKVGKGGELALDIGSLVADPEHATFSEGTTKGGSGKGTLHLTIAKRDEGDAENRLMGLDFPGPAGSVFERQATALGAILGSREPAMIMAKHDDAELEAARGRARVKVMALKPRFRDGAPQLEALMVKTPFETASGGTEWMWVEVTRWHGTTIEGLLQSEPNDVPKLRAGAAVKAQERDIFDYIHRVPDGGVEGNETGAILQGRR